MTETLEISARRPKILGAVLAGGHSSRFGSDKAYAMLHGRPLIEHAIECLRAHTQLVVVCGRQVAMEHCLKDRPKSGLGPLGGLNAALHYAAGQGYDGVLSIGCDMPLLPDEIADKLLGCGAAVVSSQHLIGHWPVALAPHLAAHLHQAKDRSIRKWLEHIQPRHISLSGKVIPNINTLSDLESISQNWDGT